MCEWGSELGGRDEKYVRKRGLCGWLEKKLPLASHALDRRTVLVGIEFDILVFRLSSLDSRPGRACVCAVGGCVRAPSDNINIL